MEAHHLSKQASRTVVIMTAKMRCGFFRRDSNENILRAVIVNILARHLQSEARKKVVTQPRLIYFAS